MGRRGSWDINGMDGKEEGRRRWEMKMWENE